MLRRSDISAVLFDLDGVAFDTKRIREERQIRIAEIMGVHAATFNFGGRHYREVLKERGFSWLQIRYFKKLHDKLREEEEKYQKILFPGAASVFRALKNYGRVTGIVTNREMKPLTLLRLFEDIKPEHIDFLVFHCPQWKILWERAKIKRKQYQPQHNYILSSYAKPDKRMLLHADGFLRDLARYPKSVCYVGDNVNDLHFARQNKFSFIGVLSGGVSDPFVWEKNGADAVIKDVAGLLKYFPDFKR